MNTQVVNLVEEAVLGRMRGKESFTALDISNALKADRYPVRHQEVSEAVREIYDSGAMEFYDYDRCLIPVTTEGGTKTAEAFLYHHAEVRASAYTARSQDALPPVADDEGRDLADCVAAGPLPILNRPAQSARRMARVGVNRSCRCRRDGALPIPRSLLRELGWTPGMALPFQALDGQLTVGPDTEDADGTVRVWSDLRLRVCRMKLRLGALKADATAIEITGRNLRIRAEES